MAEMPWDELRPVLEEHGILQGEVDRPLVLDEDLIEMVRRRLAEHPAPPVSADAAERSMRDVLPPPPPLV
jgi:hypothetical protein